MSNDISEARNVVSQFQYITRVDEFEAILKEWASNPTLFAVEPAGLIQSLYRDYCSVFQIPHRHLKIAKQNKVQSGNFNTDIIEIKLETIIFQKPIYLLNSIAINELKGLTGYEGAVYALRHVVNMQAELRRSVLNKLGDKT